jgi:hypothetical protein
MGRKRFDLGNQSNCQVAADDTGRSGAQPDGTSSFLR